MSELKTLKDLKRSVIIYGIPERQKVVHHDTLKQELAINWIKLYRKQKKNGSVIVPKKIKEDSIWYREFILINLKTNKIFPRDGERYTGNVLIEFDEITEALLITLFNLTEEDLK